MSHAPQWAVSVCRSVQTSPHRVWPAGQALSPSMGTHWLLRQSSSREQTLPQPPQLKTSLVRSTQSAPHTVWPAAQAPCGCVVDACATHLPLVQTSPIAQTVLQAPQLKTSRLISTHCSLQSALGGWQSFWLPVGGVSTHVPSSQVEPEQRLSHAPQLRAFVWRLTQPSGQSANGVTQFWAEAVASPQTPPVQLLTAQTLPQAPQFSGSTIRSAQ